MKHRVCALIYRALIIGMVAVSSGAAHAQSSATVIGIVTDPQGRPLPGAVVVGQHQPTGASVEATTATDGRYSLSVPRAGGPYKVTVNMAGFAVQERRDVIAIAAESTTVRR